MSNEDMEHWEDRTGIVLEDIFDGVSVWWVPSKKYTATGLGLGTYVNRWDRTDHPGRWLAAQAWIDTAREGT